MQSVEMPLHRLCILSRIPCCCRVSMLRADRMKEADQLPVAAPDCKTLCQSLIGLGCSCALEGRMRVLLATYWAGRFAKTQIRPDPAYKDAAHQHAMCLLQPCDTFFRSAVGALEQAQQLAHITASAKTECALLMACSFEEYVPPLIHLIAVHMQCGM